MNPVTRLDIVWNSYRPSSPVQKAVSYLNQRTVEQLLTELPEAKVHAGKRAAFDYRIYATSDLRKVEKVYILLNGFAERAGAPDSGIKNLLTDLLLAQSNARNYAIFVIGGLFSFPAGTRNRLLRHGSGALKIIADEVAELFRKTFAPGPSVTVSGFSLGGVLAPLVARAIDQKNIAVIEQVCCGEPNYIATASTKRQLLRRVASATAYRNDQIRATAIEPYIAVKKTPKTGWMMVAYRAQQYRPLFLRILSMRLLVQDLALQAHKYPPSSRDVQVQAALSYLVKRGIRVHLLHAEHSSICHQVPFTQLAEKLQLFNRGGLSVITVRGTKADHGIEEHRTLSAPFLVMPELYWTP